MTPEEIIHLQEKIVRSIRKTKRDIEEFKELTGPVAPDVAIGRISRMDAINNKSVMEAALREAESKLKGLENALNNLDSKDFGFCIKCKAPIPPGRILLMPQSPYCVKCAK